MNRSQMQSMRSGLALVGGILLLGLLLAPAASAQRGAIEDLGSFRIGRLHYPGGGDWYANPSSLPNLLRALRERCDLPVASDEINLTLDDERLYRYPMLYMTGHGSVRLADEELDRLRRYLDAGGFLWADDNYGLDRSFRELVRELYPDSELVPLGGSHPIYSSWFSLPGLPKIQNHDGDPAQGFGLFHEGRMAIFYSWSSDIGDGLEDSSVHNISADARELALQMAINVCFFALTQP